jgi:hypothetical protein
MSAARANAFNAFEGIETDVPTEQGRAVGTEITQIDRIAERQGFTSREAPEVAIKRQRGTERTVHQFTMRVAVKDSNAFVLWCEAERLSYREAFEQLVAMIPELKARRR